MNIIKRLSNFIGIKRSLKNPYPQRWGNIFNNASIAGVSVNNSSSKGIPEVYRSIKLIGEQIASLDKYVFSDSDSGKIRLDNHSITALINNPSEKYTSFSFFERIITDACLLGNGYAIIVRQGIKPIELRLIDPSTVQVVFDEEGNHYYKINANNGESILLFPSDIIHITGSILAGNCVQGLSPLELFSETLGINIAKTRYSSQFFQNGAMLNGYLQSDQTLNAEAAKRLASSWSNRFSGVNNSSKTPVLENGLKYVPIQNTLKEALLVEISKISVEEVSRIFGIPLSLLSVDQKSTFNNVEQQNRFFISYTLKSWISRIEAELNKKLLSNPSEKIEFDFSALQKADVDSQARIIDSYMKWGIITINEARKMQGLPTIQLPEADKLNIPLNMVASQKVVAKEELKEGEDG